jgi:hypothetical protein
LTTRLGPCPPTWKYVWKTYEDDGPERILVVSPRRERAVERGRREGLFLVEREGGALLVRAWKLPSRKGETVGETIRSAWDEQAEKERMKKLKKG